MQRVALWLLVLVLGTRGLASAQPAPDDTLHTASLFEGVLLPTQQAQAPPPPTPEHTGFRALVGTIGSDFKAFPLRRSTWVILGIGGASALIAHPFDEDVTRKLSESNSAGDFFVAGKWIGSAGVQAGGALGLYLVGRYIVPRTTGEPKTNKWSHLGYDLIRAQILSQALVQGVKIAVRRDRPTGECCAFPSGHAASSFAAASILERHFGYRAAWPTLAIAGYVGMSRLADNRHFLSDVLFGSAVGMASGWTVVGRHGRSDYALVPMAIPGGVQVAFVRIGAARADTVAR